MAPTPSSSAVRACSVALTPCAQGLLAKGYDIPVIDPVPLAVRMAAALIESGVSHSKITYEKPPIKPVTGYEMPPLNVTSEAAE